MNRCRYLTLSYSTVYVTLSPNRVIVLLAVYANFHKLARIESFYLYSFTLLSGSHYFVLYRTFRLYVEKSGFSCLYKVVINDRRASINLLALLLHLFKINFKFRYDWTFWNIDFAVIWSTCNVIFQKSYIKQMIHNAIFCRFF